MEEKEIEESKIGESDDASDNELFFKDLLDDSIDFEKEENLDDLPL